MLRNLVESVSDHFGDAKLALVLMTYLSHDSSMRIAARDDVERLRTAQEGATLDYKFRVEADEWWELAKDIAALANHLGGVLLVGVDETAEGTGSSAGSRSYGSLDDAPVVDCGPSVRFRHHRAGQHVDSECEVWNDALMRRRTVIAACLVSLGCSSNTTIHVIDPDSGEAPDTSSVDAACPTTTVTIPVPDSESTISSDMTMGNTAGADAMFVRNDGVTKKALVRFNVTAIPDGATIMAVRLFLPWAQKTRLSCPGPLGSCNPCAPVPMGLFDLHLVGSQWSESTVNWRDRTVSEGWVTPGANAPGDATDAVVTADHVNTADMTFDLPAEAMAMIPQWRWKNYLSFMVTSHPFAEMIIWTRNQVCMAPTKTSTLTVTYCN